MSEVASAQIGSVSQEICCSKTSTVEAFKQSNRRVRIRRRCLPRATALAAVVVLLPVLLSLIVAGVGIASFITMRGCWVMGCRRKVVRGRGQITQKLRGDNRQLGGRERRRGFPLLLWLIRPS